MLPVIASMKALIRYNGTYLFLKEETIKGAVWDLPGGKIEYGEDPEAALHREIKEEVDLTVRIVKSVGVWWFYSPKNNYQVVCSTFICEPVGEVMIDMTKNPADEHFVEYRWLSIDEILQIGDVKLEDSLRKLICEL